MVGWWSDGAHPGDRSGTAILDSHVNYAGVDGAFADLGRLRPGDRVRLTGTARGVVVRRSFVVVGTRVYAKSNLPSDKAFAQTGSGRLALVSCTGPFDPMTGNYLDNVIVYAAATSTAQLRQRGIARDHQPAGRTGNVLPRVEDMRFGMFVPQGWRLDLAGIDPAEHWDVMRDLARLADAGPWESIWVYDHFHTVPVPTDEATHEAWSLMAAFGAVTERVRLGQMCTCMGYRNPAYLAKVAATIDVVSRAAGSRWASAAAGTSTSGTPTATASRAPASGWPCWTRACRSCASSGRRARRRWSGKHYQVDGARSCRPLPLQDGGIPLWIAGGGEKKTLRIAAKYAQYTNFDATPEAFAHKSEVLAAHCRDVGTDFDAIVRSANYNVVIGETEKDVQDKLAWIDEHYQPLLPADDLERSTRSSRPARWWARRSRSSSAPGSAATWAWVTRSPTSSTPPTTAAASTCSQSKVIPALAG